MDWLQIVVLAVVQGLTEFIPVSSSAHLILVPTLTDWTDQGLTFDVAVHLGSLLAVVLYFRHDLRRMAVSWIRSLRRGNLRQAGADPDARLAWWVILSTVPVCVVGFALHDVVEGYARSPLVIGAAMIGFGLVLSFADWRASGKRSEYQLHLRDAILIGLAQVLALIPGTSRSGITMTAALLLGMSREGAARFSFLMSIPVIALASSLEVFGLIRAVQEVEWLGLVAGVVLSGASAYICIYYFIAFIQRIGMQPFVIYRIALGFLLLWIFW